MSLQLYLTPPFQQNGTEVKSAYMAALLDARAVTGRDINTGNIIDFSKSGSWSGALTYLVLIDHIGAFICKKKGDKSDSRKFIKALKNFTKLNNDERFALYALRCAFAHQYSLINVGKAKNPVDKKLLHHQFRVHRGEDFILFPNPRWDGQRKKGSNQLETLISLKKVGDCVEEIHSLLLVMATTNEIVKGGELIFISYQI